MQMMNSGHVKLPAKLMAMLGMSPVLWLRLHYVFPLFWVSGDDWVWSDHAVLFLIWMTNLSSVPVASEAVTSKDQSLRAGTMDVVQVTPSWPTYSRMDFRRKGTSGSVGCIILKHLMPRLDGFLLFFNVSLFSKSTLSELWLKEGR